MKITNDFQNMTSIACDISQRNTTRQTIADRLIAEYHENYQRKLMDYLANIDISSAQISQQPEEVFEIFVHNMFNSRSLSRGLEGTIIYFWPTNKGCSISVVTTRGERVRVNPKEDFLRLAEYRHSTDVIRNKVSRYSHNFIINQLRNMGPQSQSSKLEAQTLLEDARDNRFTCTFSGESISDCIQVLLEHAPGLKQINGARTVLVTDFGIFVKDRDEEIHMVPWSSGSQFCRHHPLSVSITELSPSELTEAYLNCTRDLLMQVFRVWLKSDRDTPFHFLSRVLTKPIIPIKSGNNKILVVNNDAGRVVQSVILQFPLLMYISNQLEFSLFGSSFAWDNKPTRDQYLKFLEYRFKKHLVFVTRGESIDANDTLYIRQDLVRRASRFSKDFVTLIGLDLLYQILETCPKYLEIVKQAKKGISNLPRSPLHRSSQRMEFDLNSYLRSVYRQIYFANRKLLNNPELEPTEILKPPISEFLNL